MGSALMTCTAGPEAHARRSQLCSGCRCVRPRQTRASAGLKRPRRCTRACARAQEPSTGANAREGGAARASADIEDGEALENAVSQLPYTGREDADAGAAGSSDAAELSTEFEAVSQPGPLAVSARDGESLSASSGQSASMSTSAATRSSSPLSSHEQSATLGTSYDGGDAMPGRAAGVAQQQVSERGGAGKGKRRKLPANPLVDRSMRQSEYRPRSALSLARRRMLAKYLPLEWQTDLRKRAEGIPEAQFNYLVSTVSILTSGTLAGMAAYVVWPAAREVIIWLFQADAVEARVLQELTFETQYLAALSLVTAILLGNTFAFSFDRQRQITCEISEEIFAIELLLQELFIEIREPHLRWRVIKHIKRYIDDEIQARDIDSPFRVDGAIMGLFGALLSLRQDEGKVISKMIRSVELLAQANSRRGALAAALLPPLHWVMLASLCFLLDTAFLLFDSDFNSPVGENRVIFSVLTAMLVTILQVLQDISAPDDGLYSVRDAMENRLTYVRWQMDNILADPAIKLSMLGTDEDAETESEAPESSADQSSKDEEPAWMRE